MKYDAIIVGAGVAGLTAAAFLSRSGCKTLLLEKEASCGGLVKTFERDGFFYDTGIRAIENSGVLFPMVRNLGLDVDFIENHVTIGIEDRVIRIVDEDSVTDYQQLLTSFYPESKTEIDQIITQIRVIMQYMDVQYGIDNPVFLDFRKDRDYLIREILPWMVKYVITAPKIGALNEPVEKFLTRFTKNQSLLDIIVQHFFHASPAFFALSYLKLFLEYHYPRGGTGALIKKLVTFIKDHDAEVRTNTQIERIDPEKKQIFDQKGEMYEFLKLIWAADIKMLYNIVDLTVITDDRVKQTVNERKDFLQDKKGNDSVLTLYLGVETEPEYFARIASEHFFYTPSKVGLTQIGSFPYAGDREDVLNWVRKYLEYTTYEISIPVLRDKTLAPQGKTGLIISTLFDYEITRYIEGKGWYKDFSTLVEEVIGYTLQKSIYPRMLDKVVHKFVSSPVTIERVAGTTGGAITGWAFTNHPIPAESRIPKILNAIRTPLPDITQAGQWTYSPSGFPTAMITGKMAADEVLKSIAKTSKKTRYGSL